MFLKAAILGTGAMGIRHANSLKNLNIPVNAICNINNQKAINFKKELKLNDTEIYNDFDTMLQNADFNILFICIPPFAHNGQFEKAANNGKNIFIEKPIALNSAIGARMVNYASKNGITTMVGFHMRQGALIKRLKELINEGVAGRPVLYSAQWMCNINPKSWWVNMDLCGGQLFEQAIHLYDLCRVFFNDPKFVEGFYSNVCHNNYPDYTIEDVSVCLAGFVTGAIASITATNCAIPGKGIGKATVIFEKLTAEFNDPNNGVITYTSGHEINSETIKSEIDLHLEEVKEFIKCIKNGKDSNCNILEGYKSLCFVETAVHSAKLDGTKLAVDMGYKGN